MFVKRKLNVFFSIDKYFVTHFSVTLISLLENNADLELGVYVIHDLEDTEDFDKVCRFVAMKYRVTVHPLHLDNSLFDHYRITHHISKATYFRLMLARIVPEQIKSGLFLDSDIVVTGSLKDLTELDFTNPDDQQRPYLLYAAHDNPAHDNIGRLQKLGLHAERYFNAGVMMINLVAWRKQEITARLLEIADKYMESLSWWDQDVLNICFIKRWGELDEKYNALCLTERRKELPFIIHFAGSSKPWHYRNKHPYKDLYFQYLRKAKYRYMTPNMIFALNKMVKVVNKTLSLNYKEVL